LADAVAALCYPRPVMSVRASRAGLRVGIAFLESLPAAARSSVEGDVRRLWGALTPLEVHHSSPAGRRELDRLLRRWSGRDGLDVACTIGAAGHRCEDYAPEVTGRLLSRALPGIEERMHCARPATAADLLFRGRAGLRGRTLLLNLPSRPARIRTVLGFLAPVLPHAMEKVRGDGGECGGGGAR